MKNNFLAKASVTINASKEIVWKALVDPEIIKQYMFGTQVVSDWKEGSAITWEGEWQGKSYKDTGKILQFIPGEKIKYSHFSPLSGLKDKPENYHTIMIELSEKEGQTELLLLQDNNPTKEAQEHSEKNWIMMLQTMKKFIEQ